MKKVLKYLVFTLLFFVSVLLIYLTSAFILSRISIDSDDKYEKKYEVYILTNGVHTDIVLPTKSHLMDWSKEVMFEHSLAADSNCKYLAMGWGDKGFYLETPTWADLKTSVAFNAAFGLSNTAIHATYYKSMKENESCKRILISEKQFIKLTNYVKSSFQKDENNHFMKIQTNANYNKFDAFYEAKGSYSALHTCNTWANNALKSSDMKCCFWTPFDTGIFLNYK